MWLNRLKLLTCIHIITKEYESGFFSFFIGLQIAFRRSSDLRIRVDKVTAQGYQDHVMPNYLQLVNKPKGHSIEGTIKRKPKGITVGRSLTILQTNLLELSELGINYLKVIKNVRTNWVKKMVLSKCVSIRKEGSKMFRDITFCPKSIRSPLPFCGHRIIVALLFSLPPDTSLSTKSLPALLNFAIGLLFVRLPVDTS